MPETRLKKKGKDLNPFTQVTQDTKETFTNFLQRLTSGENRKISDPLIKKALIKSLVFKNVNTEYKDIIQHLRA